MIDADLGLSGASVAQRSGFKELVGRVGLSEVGLILSIDVTRLARNCSDCSRCWIFVACAVALSPTATASTIRPAPTAGCFWD